MKAVNIQKDFKIDSPTTGTVSGFGIHQSYEYELQKSKTNREPIVFLIKSVYRFDDYPTDEIRFTLKLTSTTSSAVSLTSLLQTVMNTIDLEYSWEFNFHGLIETKTKKITNQNRSLSSCLSRKEDLLSHEVFKVYENGIEKYDKNVIMGIVRGLKTAYNIPHDAGLKVELPKPILKGPPPRKKAVKKEEVKEKNITSPTEVLKVDKRKLKGKVLRENTSSLYSRDHRS